VSDSLMDSVTLERDLQPDGESAAQEDGESSRSLMSPSSSRTRPTYEREAVPANGPRFSLNRMRGPRKMDGLLR